MGDAEMASTKSTTVADLVAAAKAGLIDPSTAVVTAEQAAKATAKAERKAAQEAAAQQREQDASVVAEAAAVLDPTEHRCGIVGCRHGAAHPAVSQPDRQIKLQCPHGAVARMTGSALAKAGGTIRCAEGADFVPVARRTYSPRAK